MCVYRSLTGTIKLNYTLDDLVLTFCFVCNICSSLYMCTHYIFPLEIVAWRWHLSAALSVHYKYACAVGVCVCVWQKAVDQMVWAEFNCIPATHSVTSIELFIIRLRQLPPVCRSRHGWAPGKTQSTHKNTGTHRGRNKLWPVLANKVTVFGRLDVEQIIHFNCSENILSSNFQNL